AAAAIGDALAALGGNSTPGEAVAVPPSVELDAVGSTDDGMEAIGAIAHGESTAIEAAPAMTSSAVAADAPATRSPPGRRGGRRRRGSGRSAAVAAVAAPATDVSADNGVVPPSEPVRAPIEASVPPAVQTEAEPPPAAARRPARRGRRAGATKKVADEAAA